MSNKVKDINIKICTYYFFADVININNFNLNNIKIDKRSYQNILLYFGKVNGYFEEINKNKYLTLVPSNESKGIIKKYKELWNKIRHLNRSITKNSDHCDEKYMKIKFNSVDELPLNKAIEIPSMMIIVKVVFLENNQYCPKIFLDEWLYE